MLDELPNASADTAAPAGGRSPALHHPLIYVALAALYVASVAADWPPTPGATDPVAREHEAGGAGRSFEDVLREPREVPFAAAATVLVPLLLGSGLLLGYVVLRANNVRVFPRCDFVPAPWGGGHLARAAVVLVVVLRLVALGTAWVLAAQEAEDPAWRLPRGVVLVGAANVTMVVMCLFVAALVGAGHGRPLRLLGLGERRPWSRAALGVTGFLMVFPVMFAAGLLMLILAPRVGIPAQPQEVLMRATHLSPSAFAFVLFSAVVVAPLTEEVLFRGFFYATLRRAMGPLGAIVLSAITFSLLHSYPLGFLSLFVIGFLLGYLYERTGSLVASIAAHAANNLYALLVAYMASHASVA